jgi:proliferating cell nuclear antigen
MTKVLKKSEGSGTSCVSENINKSDYIMYLVTIKSNPIRTLSEALKEILLEATFHFDENGIRVLTMDKNKSGFVHLKLDAQKFDYYYCPQPTYISIDMVSLHKLLKTINNTDIITLFIAKNDSEKLGIKIENKEKKIVSVSRLKLIDLDKEAINIPSTKFENVFNMQCVDFQKYCRDLSVIAENVDIYIKDNGEVFIMSVKGFADQEIIIGKSDDDSIDPNNNPIFIGRYELKFLNLFCKASGMCPTVEIFLKEEHPIILIYSVADLGTIKFGLSPRKIIED